MHADLYLVEIISSSTLLSVVDIILLILQEAKSPDGGLLLAKNDVDRLALGNENGNALKAFCGISILIRHANLAIPHICHSREKLQTVCKITHRV